MNIRGTSGPILSNLLINYRPGLGYDERRVYEAFDKNAILSLASQLKKEQFSVNIEQNGPKFTLTAERSGFSEDPNENSVRWEFRKEFLEKSIWTLPSVQKEIDAWTNANNPRSAYKQKIEDAVESGSPLPSEFDNYDIAKKLYIELSRGVENYETEYIVLSKSQIITLTNPTFAPFAFSNSSASVVYEHNYFLNRIIPDCPQSIKSIIDQQPPEALPQNTVWGWRERSHNGEIEYTTSARYVQTREWALAAWSTLLYQVISS